MDDTGQRSVAPVLRGRHHDARWRRHTAREQQRLRIDELQPGDLLFFGTARLHSTATEQNIIHEGIYLGDYWVIHSSRQGVYAVPLQRSWLLSPFASRE